MTKNVVRPSFPKKKQYKDVLVTTSAIRRRERVIGGVIMAKAFDYNECLRKLRKKASLAGYRKLVDMKVSMLQGDTSWKGAICYFMCATPVGK